MTNNSTRPWRRVLASQARSKLPACLPSRKRSRLQQCHFERLEDRINLDTYLWHQTAAGIFDWTNPSNWIDLNPLNSGYPHLAGDVAEVTSKLSGHETIDLDAQTMYLTTLDIGAAAGTSTFTIQDGSLEIDTG